MDPVHCRLSAVIVTTPQAVALMDAMKCLSFTRTANLPVLGLIENMSGYVCPCCGEISNVFSTGGGKEMARQEGLPFLGSMPVDTDLVTLLDAAEADKSEDMPDEATLREGAFQLLNRYQKTSSAKLFQMIVDKVVKTLPEVEGTLDIRGQASNDPCVLSLCTVFDGAYVVVQICLCTQQHPNLNPQCIDSTRRIVQS
jgi:MinD-like ATPase involved in chromosome partitioning or flagellar assembly